MCVVAFAPLENRKPSTLRPDNEQEIRHPARFPTRPECPFWVCAVQGRRFPVGANPIRQPLQPEAIGAVMEVTKWLKPSISVSRIGDSASAQAATRVNAEQSSKRVPRPTNSTTTLQLSPRSGTERASRRATSEA